MEFNETGNLGVLEDYIHCMECQTTKSRKDTFFDLQLVIKNVSSLEEALKLFSEAELLSKDNQYFCDTCQKKVNALKGLRIREVPHLLCLQLKRFDFDWATNQRIKLNNRVSFPLTLDMSPFVYNPESMQEDMIYDLFSVLVASGGAMV